MEPLKQLIEKIPFLEYLHRLVMYLVRPDIKDSSIDNNSLRYSLADAVLAFGFVVALTTYLAIFRPEYEYLGIAQALNPEPLLLSFVLYGIVFGAAFSGGYSLLALAKGKLPRGDRLVKPYYLFLHCVRFYGVLIVIAFFAFVHAAGLLVQDGRTIVNHAAEFTAAYWGIFIILIVVVFRLFVNPVRRYLPVFQNKYGTTLVIFTLMQASFAANQLVSPSFGALINKSRCQEVVQKSELFLRLPLNLRENATVTICEGEKHI